MRLGVGHGSCVPTRRKSLCPKSLFPLTEIPQNIRRPATPYRQRHRHEMANAYFLRQMGLAVASAVG
jgi:hypothetical protein